MIGSSIIIKLDNWVIRYYEPEDDSRHSKVRIILLLHGWTGDENSMWIFTEKSPPNHIIISPRGLFSAPVTGYSWHLPISSEYPTIDDFGEALFGLDNLLCEKNFPKADLSTIKIIGFSQGAALAYSYLMHNPKRISSIAGLSGFLPDGTPSMHPEIIGKPIYIAHGKDDNIVDMQKAIDCVNYFKKSGAQVTFCEADIDHKLSAGCFKGLGSFLENT